MTEAPVVHPLANSVFMTQDGPRRLGDMGRVELLDVIFALYEEKKALRSQYERNLDLLVPKRRGT